MKVKITVPSLAASIMKAKLQPVVKRAMRDALPKISAFAVNHIHEKADAVLKTSAKAYKEGMSDKTVRIVGDEITIELNGDLPQALERGFDAFDMKAKMLPHAKNRSKTGVPYIDIPYKWGTGGGKSAKSIQNMPSPTFKAVRAKVQAVQAAMAAGGATAHQVAMARVRMAQTTPGKEFTRKLRVGDKTVNQKVQHKRGLTDDLIRTGKQTKSGAVKSIYRTVRRMSANSDPSAWWHPGFKGVHLFKKSRSEIRKEARKLLKKSFKQHGLNVKV